MSMQMNDFELQYWKNVFDQIHGVNIPRDYPVNNKVTFQISKPFPIPSLKNRNTFPSEKDEIIFLTTFLLMLTRISAEENFIIGVHHLDDEKKVHSQLIHIDVEKKPTFEELVNQVKTSIVEGKKHLQNCTIKELFDKFYSNKDEQEQLVNVSFGYSKGDFEEWFSNEDVNQSPFPAPLDNIQFHLHFNQENHTASAYFCVEAFSDARITEMLEQAKQVLELALSNPKQSIYDYSMVTKQSMLVLPDPTKTLDYDFPGPIHEHFEKQAELNPNRIACVDPHEELTYKGLNDASNQLARKLIADGLKKGENVTIYGHRSNALVWAVMAILKAGGSFSIVDPAYPPQRIIDCLSVSKPTCFIEIQRAGAIPLQVQQYIVSKESTIRFTIKLPSISEAEKLGFGKELKTENLGINVTADDIAVITFTSGSTGMPKGVLGRHGPLTHYYPWMAKTFGFTSNDRFSMQSGISHDPLQRDIFTPFFLGATLYVPDREDIVNPGRLASWFQKNKITITHLTPAMGQLLATTETNCQTKTQLPDLRYAFFVGDVLTKKFVAHLSEFAKNCTVINMYGSTETQRSVTYFKVPNPNTEAEKFNLLRDRLPVGKGMGDNSVQALVIARNTSFKLAGIGEIGEIYMRSPHLAKGYKEKEDETNKKFIINPLTNDPRDRMYCTGDLGRYLPSGDVECSGRADDQIKIRGFRIELGEINSALINHEIVKESVTIVRTDVVPGEKRIVAYVVLETKGGEKGEIIRLLRNYLRSKLPIYMIPSALVILDKMPLTPNGKIKKDELPRPIMDSSNTDYVEPRNELEQKLVEIWSQVLNIKKIGIHDNFFDLGGHSILATNLVFKMRQEIKGAETLPVEVLFSAPTVGGIAVVIANMREGRSLMDITAAQSITNFYDDTIVDPSIVVDENIKFEYSEKYENPSTVLLTGSTGFLGAYILHELLETTSSTIYCLVRAKDKEAAFSRLKQSQINHKLWRDEYEKRIVIIVGDFSKPRLGVDEKTWEELCSLIDVIIHNGALVHWMYPYEKLKAPNVLSTQEIIRLAAQKKIKPIHYVSTTSVFDSDHYSELSDIYEDTTLPYYEDIRGGYPQSKFVAEKLCMNARKLGIPTCIYRPGYITGHSQTGIWNPDDFLCRMIKGCVQLGYYPDLYETKLDMTPVDFVSKAIVALFKKKDSIMKHKAYHLVNPHEFFFNALFETANRLGYEVKKLDYVKWKKMLFEEVMKTKEKNALYPMLSYFSDDWGTRMRTKRPWYDNTFTLDGLKGTGISCPPVIELMGTYYRFLCMCGFMQKPEKPSRLAKAKKIFDFDEKDLENQDFTTLMRNNRIDSSDLLSDF